MISGKMSGQRHAGSKRNACDDSHAAEDNFAYIPQDNRKGGRAVNSCCVGVAYMESFSYAGLAHQQRYVAASTPFSSLRSSLTMDVVKLEGKSERDDEQYNVMMTATKSSCHQNSQLLPF